MTPLLFVLACGPDTDPPRPVRLDPASFGPKVGTTPDFYGFVPRNLLWISIDTFRRDTLALHGGTGLTPFLDGLEGAGYALTEHHTASNWTFAGTTGNLLGRTHEENGFMPKLSNADRLPFPDGTPMLPDWLRPEGFYSVVVSSNSWYGPEWKSTQAFDEELLPPNAGALNVAAEGIQRIQAAKADGLADRWFLHLHIKEPHAPYNPPEEYLDGLDALPEVEWDLSDKDEHYSLLAEWPTLSAEDQALITQHLRVRYEAELAYTDDLVESMWIDLLSAGMLDDTLLMVWNDHGEGFFEHDTQGHAYKLYPEENMGVMFFWAFNIVQGRWSEPTAAADLAPSVLSLFGIDNPPEVTGLALGTAAADRPVFASTVARLSPRNAVRMGDYRLEYSWDGRAWLYDVVNDPVQANDLLAAEPDIAAELWGQLEPQVALGEPLSPEFAQIPPPIP